MSELSHVAQGDPHVLAHNQERDFFNSIYESVVGLSDLTMSGRLSQTGTVSNLQEFGPGEIAFAENRIGILTNFNTTAAMVLGCLVVVPPTTRPVTLEWKGSMGIAATPSPGRIVTSVYEITGGVLTARGSHATKVTSSDVAGVHTSHRASQPIGPSTNTRTFALYGQVVRDAGSTTLAAYFVNANNGYDSTWLRAVAQ